MIYVSFWTNIAAPIIVAVLVLWWIVRDERSRNK